MWSASRASAAAAPITSSASTGPGTRLLSAESRTVCWSNIVFRVSTYSFGAVAIGAAHGAAGEPPQLPLDRVLGCRGAPHAVAGRDLARDADRLIRVAPQQVERLRADRLVEVLRAEVGGADRVRLGHRRRAPVLVATDRQRQPEREDQADESEQRGLQHAERLPERARVLPQVRPAAKPATVKVAVTAKMRRTSPSSAAGRTPRNHDARGWRGDRAAGPPGCYRKTSTARAITRPIVRRWPAA